LLLIGTSERKLKLKAPQIKNYKPSLSIMKVWMKF
jgi:hypothetical protein